MHIKKQTSSFLMDAQVMHCTCSLHSIKSLRAMYFVYAWVICTLRGPKQNTVQTWHKRNIQVKNTEQAWKMFVPWSLLDLSNHWATDSFTAWCHMEQDNVMTFGYSGQADSNDWSISFSDLVLSKEEQPERIMSAVWWLKVLNDCPWEI